MPVIKKSGKEQQFDIVKLFSSIRKSGVTPDEALKIANEVKKSIKGDTSTGEIKGKVHKVLAKKDSNAAYNYSHHKKK